MLLKGHLQASQSRKINTRFTRKSHIQKHRQFDGSPEYNCHCHVEKNLIHASSALCLCKAYFCCWSMLDLYRQLNVFAKLLMHVVGLNGEKEEGTFLALKKSPTTLLSSFLCMRSRACFQLPAWVGFMIPPAHLM
jgi:hypothetical protein